MKSFDRRSFGKLLLGAVPAVFLAKSATAGATPDSKDPLGHTNMARSIPAHCGNTVKNTYSCGHSSLYRYTAGDPAGLLGFQVLPNDPHPSVVYEVVSMQPCPDCRKKQIESGVVDIHPYNLRFMYKTVRPVL